MVNRIIRCGLVVAGSVALLGLGNTAFAQQNPQPGDKALSFGAQVNWSVDAFLGGIGVGGRVIVGLDQLVENLEAVGSFDYYFPGDDFSYFEVSANGVYKLDLDNSSLRPYFGAGLSIARSRIDVTALGVSTTDVGLNLVGGVLFANRFFAEAKFEVGGAETIVVSGGIRF